MAAIKYMNYFSLGYNLHCKIDEYLQGTEFWVNGGRNEPKVLCMLSKFPPLGNSPSQQCRSLCWVCFHFV